MKKIRVGLIGYGYWGPNIARVLEEFSDVELVYCADLLENSLEQVRQKYPTIRTTQNYKTILQDNEIDAVFIVTPTKTHFQIAKDCLIAKKHVFVEKPITYETKQCKELIKIAKKNHRILAVGHIFLFNPAVNLIKKLIDEKSLGTIRYLHFQRRNLGPVRKDVNVLWDLAPHDISMLLYFINYQPLSVIAVGQSFLQDNVEDVVSATVKFKNKVMANFTYSWIDPIKIRDMTIIGDKKMLSFNDVTVGEKIRIFDKNAKIIEETRDVSFGEYQIALHSGDIYIPSIDNKEPLKEELHYFLNCIQHNKKPLNDGMNGLKVIQIIEALQKSLDMNSKEVFLK